MSNSTSFLKKLDAGQILDVATGSGGFLKYITDQVRSFSEAIGIDMKESASAAFEDAFQQNPKAHFQVMDAVMLDFPDAAIDTVCISNSLHHMTLPEKVLREMFRVLKPGGVFILSEMYHDGQQHPAQQTHILFHHWMASVDRSQNVIHNETYSRQELLDFVTNLDLEQILEEDQANLTGDPLDPEVWNELEPIVQRYIDRTVESSPFYQQGRQILERLQKIGFYNASSLLLIAQKEK